MQTWTTGCWQQPSRVESWTLWLQEEKKIQNYKNLRIIRTNDNQTKTEGEQKTELQLSGPQPPGCKPGHSEPGRTERLNTKCSWLIF